MWKKGLFSLILLIFANITPGNGERTRDRMYIQVNGIAVCVRRLNGTHQTGCSSSQGGSTGAIHIVDDVADLDQILKDGTGGPYIPVMPVTLLRPDVVQKLKGTTQVSGVVVYKNNETMLVQYSHEERCPNANFAMNDTCDVKWNNPGTGILNYDFAFPIFHVTLDEDLRAIRECFDRFNNFSLETQNERSLCSLELSSFMFATIDTPTCLRRSNPLFVLNKVKFCDSMGDENVWSSLFPVGNSSVHFGNESRSPTVRSDMKYIVVAARLDTSSLFLHLAPGAINPVTSIVALLTTAKLLKTMLPVYKNYDTNVLFVLFNGETYDYIGSQRLLYDMEHSQFPTTRIENVNETVPTIHAENISLFVELNQLSKSDALHVHAHHEKPEIRNFITLLKKNMNGIKISESIRQRLPPASLQTFLLSNPDMPGLVLADHGQTYANKFYNSMYDDADNLNFRYYEDGGGIPEDSIQRYVFNVSKVLAKSLYEQITRSSAKQVDDQVMLVNELFNCYLSDTNCKIHQAIQSRKFSEEPLSMYVGVPSAPNLLTGLVGLTLGWFTADVVNDNGECPYNIAHSQVNRYFNMSKSVDDLNTTLCYRTCMNFTDAESPAFIIPDYDWKSGQYSTWSESVWTEFNARIFLRPSRAHESMTIAVGTMTMVLSFALVYFIKSRSQILFPPAVDIPPTRC